MQPRPYITAILAMSADGKIADASRAAARFPTAADQVHLEAQVAKADATLFGAGTLRAYGTTMSVMDKGLIGERRDRTQPDQPIQIVCTATGNLDPTCRFFAQPIPRWLITTAEGIQSWRDGKALPREDRTASTPANTRPFHQILITERPFNWLNLMQDLRTGKATLSDTTRRPPIEKLLVMGGGELVASLLADGLIDELHLTICPLLIGGKTAPSPVGGLGFLVARSPQLKLLSSRVEGDEVFLHYKVSNTASS